MAEWGKLFTRIFWRNRPNSNTPLGENNLNKMDKALDEIDNRVLTLNTTKADLSVINDMVASVVLEKNTGIITVTYKNGSVDTYDTALEKIAVNFDFDETTKELVILLEDATEKRIDLSALITEYSFTDTDTIAFTNTNGNVTASVKNGSITNEMLQSDYLAEIKVETGKAEASASDSKSYSDNAEYESKLAKSYAIGDESVREGSLTDNAKYYSEQAQSVTQGLVENVGDTSQLDTDSKVVVNAINEVNEKVGDGGGVEKTYAEYNALPESEKKSGKVFYVPDYPSDNFNASMIDYKDSESVKDALDSIGEEIDLLGGMLKLVNYSVTWSLTAGEGKSYTIQTNLPAGYRILGVVRYNTNFYNVIPYTINVVSNNIVVNLRNFHTGTASNTFSCYALLAKGHYVA